jgi:peptidoglycan L-alanyl-D-glutamate endopeptidase CwlK
MVCVCLEAISVRDEQRLSQLDPAFGARMRTLLRMMAVAGHRMFVTSTLRTDAEQAALYAKGRTAPGPIVTACDGIRRRSKHQDGLACDCAWVGDDIWDGPWELYAAVAEGLGLMAGAHWRSFPDKPHVEMR